VRGDTPAPHARHSEGVRRSYSEGLDAPGCMTDTHCCTTRSARYLTAGLRPSFEGHVPHALSHHALRSLSHRRFAPLISRGMSHAHYRITRSARYRNAGMRPSFEGHVPLALLRYALRSLSHRRLAPLFRVACPTRTIALRAPLVVAPPGTLGDTSTQALGIPQHELGDTSTQVSGKTWVPRGWVYTFILI
jgi:hypothetical protein